MKMYLLRPLKAWFGYTRRERKASLILIILTVIIGAARYTVPESDMELKVLPYDSIPIHLPGESQDKQKLPGARSNANRPAPIRSAPVNINTCDSAMLENLPGIGPVLAARIIKYRNLLGGFAFVDQLKEVYGLPPETFELIEKRVFTDSTVVSRINLNTADFTRLIRFPYLEKYEVNAILKYREIEGKFEEVDELFDNKLVSEEKKSKIRVYFEVE